jgi:glycine/D-amino acid oxidase-like deaminating enzyme
MDKQIIVIGAGVIGLTTALSLKQKGYQHVTIVAKYFPGNMSIEYTSPYAGNFLFT